MKNISCLLFLCFFVNNLSAQSTTVNTDSLISVANELPKDTSKLRYLYQTANELKSTHPEEAYYVAKYFYGEAKKQTEKTWQAKAMNEIGSYFLERAELDSAYYYFNQACISASDAKSRKGLAIPMHNLAMVYFEKGMIDTSLTYVNKVLPINQEFRDSFEIARNYNYLG